MGILINLIGFLIFAGLATYVFKMVIETPAMLFMPFILVYEVGKYVVVGMVNEAEFGVVFYLLGFLTFIGIMLYVIQ